MKIISRKRSKGFTLVEILLVVGFIALASIGIYAVYNKVATTQKASETARGLLLIKNGINELFAGQINYDGVSNQVVINARIAPPSWINGSGELVHPFGGAINIGWGGAGNALQITLSDVPDEACIKVVTSVASHFKSGPGAMAMGRNVSYTIGFDQTRLINDCTSSPSASMTFTAIK